MVFAPAPQLTVTVERPQEADELHLHAGGQGIWEARMLRVLGVPVTLCAALGGEAGAALERFIADEQVTLRLVRRQSDSGWYVHDRRDGERREIAASAGLPLGRHELDELYGLGLLEGLRSAVSLLSGPMQPQLVPPQLYRRLAADLTNNGGRVVADLSGEHLDAALAGGLSLVKVSHEEVIADGRAASDATADLVGALHRLRDDGASNVVISRAGEPALALLDDEVFTVTAPALEVAEHRGAGDSMTAAMAAVLASSDDLHLAVRTGAAAGAVNVTRHGLGTGRAEVVAEIAARTTLQPLDG